MQAVRRAHRLLGPEHEARIREDALDAEADAVLEIAAVLPRAIVDGEQVVDVVANRAAIRLRRKTAQDVAGAPPLLTRRRRMAREDLSPARRLRHAGHAQRT